MNKFIVLTLLSVILGLSACSSTVDKKVMTNAVENQYPKILTTPDNTDLYIVMSASRVNVFYDDGLYIKYLKTEKIPYRRTFIGKGPAGKTLVYGLTEASKKSSTNPAEEIWNGKLAAADDFYGEVYNQKNNSFYVFSSWADLEQFVKFQKTSLEHTYTENTPSGAKVVYVLDEDSKNKKPTKLITKFKKLHL